MLRSGKKNYVLITGASRGIGLALCRYYLERGYPVLAACRQPEALAAVLGEYKNVRIEALDIADENSIQHFAECVESLQLQIDLLINNAGVTIDQTFGKWTQQAFLHSMNVNAVGPALLVQALQGSLNAGAKVIQLSSGLGSIGGVGEQADPFCAYAMSKAAINMLTAKLAVIVKERAICVAAFSPGWVQTDMGGPDAPETVDELVVKLCPSIDALTLAHSGGFYEADGKKINW